MTQKELDKILAVKSENEHIEFKEAKEKFSILGGKDKNRKSLYGYCVAIGNEGGGKIILGVKDKTNTETGKRDIVGTKSFNNITQVKSQIYGVLKHRIDIEEMKTEQGRIVIIYIPPRPVGRAFKFYGTKLMRDGEGLTEMDDNTEINIFNENIKDFSAEICEGIDINDLDRNAIKILKLRWSKKSGNKEYNNLTNENILRKLLLMKENKITYAGLLLLGKEKILSQYLSNMEFIFEWRAEKGKVSFDFKKSWRNAFLLIHDDIWNIINYRNSRIPFKQGFIELNIWSFDEQSVREAVLNAFAHREYKNRTEPVFIKLSPEEISIKSPGGFLPGVNPENVLDVEGKWRNRLLMEVLEKVGLVERSGVGMDRIFKETISNGKGAPNFDGSDYDYVTLNMPTVVKDINFVYFLEKIAKERQVVFNDVKDIIYLENIKLTGKIDDRQKREQFLKLGVIEKTGRGRGIKYLLSKKFYDFIGHKGEYTRKKWLSEEQQKEVLLNYFKQHKKGRMIDFVELFESKLNRIQIQKLLSKLRMDNTIFFDGKQRSKTAHWRIKKQK
jgi:ATP-dependent DNA helicase RecG